MLFRSVTVFTLTLMLGLVQLGCSKETSFWSQIHALEGRSISDNNAKSLELLRP